MARAGLAYQRVEKQYSYETGGQLCDDATSFSHLEGYVYDPIDTLRVVVPPGATNPSLP